MFERDEIDLLEEDIDDIYREHEPTKFGRVLKMEERVLQEQLETEEEFEADLVLRVGPERFLKETMREFVQPQPKNESLNDIL
jgi:hypothetical protein